MSNQELSNFSNEQILKELFDRGLIVSTKTQKLIQQDLEKDKLEETWKLIATRGKPTVDKECSRCGEIKPASDFSYYMQRVMKNGFSQNSNAVCSSCVSFSNKELKQAIKNAGGTGKKPAPGSVCSHCEREWFGNWHRHHQGDKFLGWLCGHCNMSFSDHRNEKVMKKRLNK